MRSALITGVTGQDGWYLANHLLSEGTRVYGLVRRCSRDTALAGVPEGVIPVFGDLLDADIEMPEPPDEIYHLAAFSHVGDSFKHSELVMQTNVTGTARMLEGARRCGAHVYFASTSEIFGNEPAPQNEHTRFDPRSPYAVSKVAAHYLCRQYREAYGMHIAIGILFNHESPRRGADFVTQKVCTAAARIYLGLQEGVELSTVDTCRDWGHADDYTRGMIQMLRHDTPEDWVLATGTTRPVSELCKVAFDAVDLDWRDYVHVNPDKQRPAEVECLQGNSQKARHLLGWQTKWTFNQLIRSMVAHAIKREKANSGIDLGRGRDRGGDCGTEERVHNLRLDSPAFRDHVW